MKNILLLFVTISFGISTNGQSLKIGIGGGPAFIQSSGIPSSEDIENNINFNKGYQIGGRVKLGLLPINLIGQINYSKLNGDGTVKLTGISPEHYDSDYNTSFLSIVIGAQYKLIPAPITPHIDFDLMLTSFGETTLKTVITNARELKMEGKDRLGIAFGAGIDISSFEITLKYNMHNLFGKEDRETNLNTVTLTGSLLFDIL